MIEHLHHWHAGRDPVRLALKYKAMSASLADFVRGTCSLFYLRASRTTLPSSPALPICGDVHVGNFGIYRGDDGRLRFDLNDFDESATAPILHDLIRLLAAFLTTTPDAESGVEMAAFAHKAYVTTLSSQAHAALDAEHRESPLPDLFRLASRREQKRTDWLDERTVLGPQGERRFTLDRVKTLAATEDERHALFRAAGDLGRSFGAESIFEPIDAARRISGLGSLGLPRFLLMVRGDAAGARLLDIKAARRSALSEGLGLPEGKAAEGDDADRIVAAQTLILERPSSPVAAIGLFDDRFTVRELQAAGVRLEPSLTYSTRLGRVLGESLARAHRRTSRRAGSTGELDAFAEEAPQWSARAAAAALELSHKCREDWRAFREAYRAGAFAPRDA